MKRIPFPTGAIVAGAALAQLPTADAIATASSRAPLEAKIATSSSNVVVVQKASSHDENSQAQKISALNEHEWTQRHERRFLWLAEREALGNISELEQSELDSLSALRNTLKHPRSGEEVLSDFEHRLRTCDLLAALQRYVSFHEAANYSKVQTKA